MTKLIFGLLILGILSKKKNCKFFLIKMNVYYLSELYFDLIIKHRIYYIFI